MNVVAGSLSGDAGGGREVGACSGAVIPRWEATIQKQLTLIVNATCRLCSRTFNQTAELYVCL